MNVILVQKHILLKDFKLKSDRNYLAGHIENQMFSVEKVYNSFASASADNFSKLS
jgi:hypothetical protein